jgi:hypothetical protein
MVLGQPAIGISLAISQYVTASFPEDGSGCKPKFNLGSKTGAPKEEL